MVLRSENETSALRLCCPLLFAVDESAATAVGADCELLFILISASSPESAISGSRTVLRTYASDAFGYKCHLGIDIRHASYIECYRVIFREQQVITQHRPPTSTAINVFSAGCGQEDTIFRS